MKTIAIFSALTFALIITGISTGLAKQKQNVPANRVAKIYYHVTVAGDPMRTLCNTYKVEITDANGNLVAPAQVYIPGTMNYSFEESTRLNAGIRIARLEIMTYGPEHFVCDQELFASPDVKLLHFQDGQVVQFNLYLHSKQPAKAL
jgi:hypothetical protein